MPPTDTLKPAKLGDPKAHQPHNHPNSQPRGGFIVHRRGSNRGDLIGRVRPTEHASLEGAMSEASRLAALHEREFAVFQEVWSAPAAAAVAHQKAA